MIEITTTMVKELRERTGAGIMDCKKALTEANNDIELAIKIMHKLGTIKAAKKAGNIAVNGVIKIKIDGNYGMILEVNCQTDFVARNSWFKAFTDKVLDVALISRVTDVNILKVQLEEERSALVAKINENVNIRRIAVLKGDTIGSYLHDTRIGVLIKTKSENKELIKQIAMHIAASKPEFIKPEDVPTEMIKKEYQIQLDIAMRSGKSRKIIEKMVEGRMKKFIDEISLTSQLFVVDPSKTVGQFLREKNTDITSFIRFEVGERLKEIENNL